MNIDERNANRILATKKYGRDDSIFEATRNAVVALLSKVYIIREEQFTTRRLTLGITARLDSTFAAEQKVHAEIMGTFCEAPFLHACDITSYRFTLLAN